MGTNIPEYGTKQIVMSYNAVCFQYFAKWSNFSSILIVGAVGMQSGLLGLLGRSEEVISSNDVVKFSLKSPPVDKTVLMFQ